MNKLISGFLGVFLLGGPGAAQAFTSWTAEAQGGFDQLKESQLKLQQLAEARTSTDGVSIAAVVARLLQAVERLERADRENPKTRLDDWEIRANPYRTAPGNNGKVDAKEAASTQDAMAISFYDAAATYHGEPYFEGGSPGGFKEKVMPAFDVPYGDLGIVEQNMEQILARLNDDGTGVLNEYKLARLSAEIAAYYTEAFPSDAPRSARRSPISWAKIEKAVRDAAAISSQKTAAK